MKNSTTFLFHFNVLGYICVLRLLCRHFPRKYFVMQLNINLFFCLALGTTEENDMTFEEESIWRINVASFTIRSLIRFVGWQSLARNEAALIMASGLLGLFDSIRLISHTSKREEPAQVYVFLVVYLNLVTGIDFLLRWVLLLPYFSGFAFRNEESGT